MMHIELWSNDRCNHKNHKQNMYWSRDISEWWKIHISQWSNGEKALL